MKGFCYPVIVLPKGIERITIQFVRYSLEIEDCHIPFEDILWIKAKDIDSCMITFTQKRVVTVKLNLQTFEKELPAEDFVMINHICIVNLMQVKSLAGNSLNVGDTFLTISPDFRKRVFRHFEFIGVRNSPE